jgi:hypothetical protein
VLDCLRLPVDLGRALTKSTGQTFHRQMIGEIGPGCGALEPVPARRLAKRALITDLAGLPGRENPGPAK